MPDIIEVPLPGGGKALLRAPSYDEYFDLGEIETLGQSTDKTVFKVQNPEILKSYIKTCLIEPQDPSAGGIHLARALKSAMLKLFRDEVESKAGQSIVRIPVPGGLNGHGTVHHEVVLRAPTYEEFLELDEIETYGQSPDGTIFLVQNPEVLRSYIAACLVEPKDPLLLAQGGLKLARAVKGAVLGFFLDESSEDETSETSPTTSSSDATPDASQPTPSAS